MIMMDKCDYMIISENCDQVALTEHYDEVAIAAVFAFCSSQDPISF
jgi:hypothetical protein